MDSTLVRLRDCGNGYLFPWAYVSVSALSLYLLAESPGREGALNSICWMKAWKIYIPRAVCAGWEKETWKRWGIYKPARGRGHRPKACPSAGAGLIWGFRQLALASPGLAYNHMCLWSHRYLQVPNILRQGKNLFFSFWRNDSQDSLERVVTKLLTENIQQQKIFKILAWPSEWNCRWSPGKHLGAACSTWGPPRCPAAKRAPTDSLFHVVLCSPVVPFPPKKGWPVTNRILWKWQQVTCEVGSYSYLLLWGHMLWG